MCTFFDEVMDEKRFAGFHEPLFRCMKMGVLN